MDPSDRYVISEPLTKELGNVRSPVRQFFDGYFGPGLRAVQKQYRDAQPSLVVPPAGKQGANPSTVGTASDWLMRFLMHPQPDMRLALAGVMNATLAGIKLLGGFAQVLEAVGIPNAVLADDMRAISGAAPRPARCRFDGPAAGCVADPQVLNRACWAIALLTEAFRGGLPAIARGPLGRFAGRSRVTGDELLALAPPDGVDQLGRFRRVFTDILLPQLAGYRGTWALGPSFTGSRLIKADADVITAGLLLDLKTTTARFSLPVGDLYQIIGYALLDTDDEFGLSQVGLFSARYGHLATWELSSLLGALAEREVSVPALRAEFRELLLAHQPRPGQGSQS